MIGKDVTETELCFVNGFALGVLVFSILISIVKTFLPESDFLAVISAIAAARLPYASEIPFPFSICLMKSQENYVCLQYRLIVQRKL